VSFESATPRPRDWLFTIGDAVDDEPHGPSAPPTDWR
jgi:hypothetical protein